MLRWASVDHESLVIILSAAGSPLDGGSLAALSDPSVVWVRVGCEGPDAWLAALVRHGDPPDAVRHRVRRRGAVRGGDFFFATKAVEGAQIPGTNARLPGFESPRRGDIIVFAYPKNPELNYVKRVIGVAGDRVEMRIGEVRVNGKALSEPYVQRVHPGHDVSDPEFNSQKDYLRGAAGALRAYHPTRDTWGPLLVPPGKFFVLGDNRDNSADSRYWGFVDANAVKGRPLVVYFSYDREAHDALPWLTDIRWRRLGSVIH